MSALADYRLLWNAAFNHWQRTSVVLLAKVLAALLALIGLGMGIMRHDLVLGVRVGVGIPMLVLLLVWTMIVPPCLALMNTPANAKLVPRLRKRSVELTAAGWICTGIFGLLTPFAAATPLIVLWVISMSGGRSGNRVATGGVLLAAMSGTIVKNLPDRLLAFCSSVPGTLALCLLVAAYGAWIIRSVIPNGGDRHFSQRKRQVEVIERFRSMGRKPAKPDRKPVVNVYGMVLNRAITGGRASNLMLLGLGPGAHWTAMLPFCLCFLGGGFALHLLFGAASPADSSIAGWVLLVTMVGIVQLAFFSQWKSLIATGRNEAALLRLAPLCPNARQWNRSFGVALVRNGLTFSLLTVVSTAVLALLDGASREELIGLSAIAVTLAMPGIAWMLRDYSKEEPARRSLILVIPAAFAVLAGLVGMLGLQMAIGAMAWVLLAAAANVIGLLAAVWRWKQMMAAPPAFSA